MMEGNRQPIKRERLYSLSGRARRLEWLFTVVIAGVVIGFIAPLDPPVSYVWIAPLAYIIAAVSVRRLHDMNQTGWLIGIPYVVLIVVGIVYWLLIAWGIVLSPAETGPETGSPVLEILAMVVTPVITGVVGCMAVLPGTKGPNSYGE